MVEKLELRTQVFRKIDQIPAEDWNRVFPNVLEGYQFFKSLDQSNFQQFSFYYILVYDRETLVGATSCFLMNYPLDTTLQGLLKKFVASVRKIFPDFFNLKALVCGLPMGEGRIGFVGEFDRIIQAILEEMEQIAKAEQVAIIAFKDFSLPRLPLLDPLKEKGFYKFEDFPSTEMDIHFTSFDDYLKTLSRASREGVKRKFRKLDGRVKIDLEISNELNGIVEEIHGLYLQTVRKAVGEGATHFEIVPKEFFENISKNMPQETKYFLWRLDQKLVAFTFCLVSEDRFIDYYLGFDYRIAYTYPLYYIRFRDLMNWCIEHRIKKYEMGATGYESKRRLGFGFIRLHGYVKHRNRWINPLFRILCTLLKPENFDPVFKHMKRKNNLTKAPS